MNKLRKIAELPSLILTERQLFDLEMILIGGFAPLKGFLNEADYVSVLEKNRLESGELWPIPITLDATDKQGLPQDIKKGAEIVLRDEYNTPIAFRVVESIYTPNKEYEARTVYGTNDTTHPGVRYLQEKTGSIYLGGSVRKIELPRHYDFLALRHSPQELKKEFRKRGIDHIIAFQTRNPIHRAHYELITKASRELNAHVLIHPVVGPTKEGDIDYIPRVQSYRALIEKYGHEMTLSLLPLAMRMAGPREALWHALIRKNYGVTHFIVGRDHAGPGKDSSGKPFYGRYEAQEFVKKYAAEIGIEILAFPEQVYHEGRGEYIGTDEIKDEDKPHILTISGTEFRNKLLSGESIPSWFSFPEVIGALRLYIPKKGTVILFTGLSGAGKSTIAQHLKSYLEIDHRQPVTFLDGDVVRRELNAGLGFSKEDRLKNIQRIGYVAAEIAKHGGTVIVSLVSPLEEARKCFRKLIEPYADYTEVYIKAPLALLQERDTKGYYLKSELGLMKNLTGVHDVYEEPKNPHFVIDTSLLSIKEAVGVLKPKFKK